MISNQIYHDEDYIIQMTVKFNSDIIDPIFAYTIRGIDGLELTGTNTLNLNYSSGLIRSGQVVTVQFSQTMILNVGNYFLALGCTKYTQDNLTVYNRIYDATVVEVISANLGTGVAFVVSDFNLMRLN